MANLIHTNDSQPRELLDTMERMGFFLEISPRAQKLVDDIAANGNFITNIDFGDTPTVEFCLYNSIPFREIGDMIGGEIEHVDLSIGHSLVLKFKHQQLD